MRIAARVCSGWCHDALADYLDSGEPHRALPPAGLYLRYSLHRLTARCAGTLCVAAGVRPHGSAWAGKCCRLRGGSKFACVDSRKKVKAAQVLPVRPLLALAAIYSRGTCRPTTIDVLMFHFRVRNGTGWGHQAVTTRLRRFFVCGAVCPGVIAGLVCEVWCSFREGEDWHPQGDGIYDLLCTMYYFELSLNQVFLKAATRGGVEVNWMLVALG